MMGKNHELYIVRPDGTQVPVEIGLHPVETAEGRFILATISQCPQPADPAAIVGERRFSSVGNSQ